MAKTFNFLIFGKERKGKNELYRFQNIRFGNLKNDRKGPSIYSGAFLRKFQKSKNWNAYFLYEFKLLKLVSRLIIGTASPKFIQWTVRINMVW